MSMQTVEIEAETLEAARDKIKQQIPAGFNLFSESIIFDGKPRIVKALADTTQEALEKAQLEIPSAGMVLAQKEIFAPKSLSLLVDAFDEQTARSDAKQQAMTQLGETAKVRTVQLKIPGRRGFFGIGKRPGQYEVQVFRQAAVEIIYKTKARVSFELLDAAEIAERKRLDEERSNREYEEQLAEEAYERRRHWEAMEDDEAWQNAHSVPDFYGGLKDLLKGSSSRDDET